MAEGFASPLAVPGVCLADCSAAAWAMWFSGNCGLFTQWVAPPATLWRDDWWSDWSHDCVSTHAHCQSLSRERCCAAMLCFDEWLQQNTQRDGSIRLSTVLDRPGCDFIPTFQLLSSWVWSGMLPLHPKTGSSLAKCLPPRLPRVDISLYIKDYKKPCLVRMWKGREISPGWVTQTWGL